MTRPTYFPVDVDGVRMYRTSDGSTFAYESDARLYADPELTDRAARAEIKRLREEHPELVEAVISSTLIASPLAGPQRILSEIMSLL